MEKWQRELTSPNHLSRAGWTKHTLGPGDQVTFSGLRAKSGATTLWVTKVLAADGHEIPWLLGTKVRSVDAKITTGPLLVQEWNVDELHRRVLQLESAGFIARRDSYRVIAEMNPETGEIIHLHTVKNVRRFRPRGEPQ